MLKYILLSAAVLTLIMGCVLAKTNPTPKPYNPIYNNDEKVPIQTIGTFKRTDLLIAYYKSEVHASFLRSLTAFRDIALETGEEELKTRIENAGAATQELAHLQLAGKAPLTNIVCVLEDTLPSVARAAGVEAICEEGQTGDSAVRIEDVTPLLVELLTPAQPGDSRTSVLLERE